MYEEMFLVGIYLMDFYFILYNYYLDLLDPSNVCFYFLPIKSTFYKYSIEKISFNSIILTTF